MNSATIDVRVRKHEPGEETSSIHPELWRLVKEEVTLHGRKYRVEKVVSRDRPMIMLHGERGACYALSKNYFHHNAYFLIHAKGKFGIVNEFKGEWFMINEEGNIVPF